MNIATLIVVAFLVLTLLMGIYFSSKKTTFREYAVGNKQFATATLVATVLATFFEGGGLVRNVECIHDLGLWFAVILLLVPCGIWIISRLSLRMGPFMQHLSIADTMGSIYGKYPRAITVLVSVCRSIILTTSQILIMSQAISMCVTLVNPYIIPVFSTLILIFYSMFGGVRAVTFTDVFQFITFSIIIPLLCWFTLVGLEKPVVTIVPMLQSHTKFQFSNLFNIKLIGIVLLLLADMPSYVVEPALMQRVYMASSPIQARKVFSYATVFSIIIQGFIVLIALFTFVGAPDLPKAEIWDYIVAHIPPLFKGFLTISLLAMAMSTADSALNSCSVMVSHDVVKSLQKGEKIADSAQLKIAKWTTLIVGLLSMLLAFKYQDLLGLVLWSLDCKVPILTAPFILAIFGFRGTSRTALIGMATGVLTILAWNRWLEPITEMDGAFLAMLANGLAMLAAHYLLKQPKGTGWVEPGNEFKQMQQENARKYAERKETIKNAWANRKATLAKLMPSDLTLCLTGLYMIATAILGYWFITPDRIYWTIWQGLLGALFTSSKTFFSRILPGYWIGLYWLMGLVVYLPTSLVWHWCHSVDLIFSVSLTLAHCAIILWVLPLYLGITVVATTLLVGPMAIGWSFAILSSLFPLFVAILFVLAIIICFKIKQGGYITQILYLKDQREVQEAQKLKASLYEAAMVPPTAVSKAKGYGFILAQVVRKMEESISFLDSNIPLCKQDFQSIINKLYDWIAYFNRKEKAKHHVLLQPTKITLDKLMRKVECALSQEVSNPPRLLVEKINAPNRATCSHIVCDINQVAYLLGQAILRVGKPAGFHAPIVRVQLHTTVLQFKQSNPIDQGDPSFITFQAIGLVISQVTTSAEALPKVKERYEDSMNAIGTQGQQEAPPSIDLQQETMATIVGAHYGYLETAMDGKRPAMLLVLPSDVTEILHKMTIELPIDALTVDTPVTPKEQADSMMALMQFHDYVCKSSYQGDPVDISTISGLLLLLRQHFRFRRHASGQLFYVRAVGIAALVVEWAFHSPKVIYASLLYELVRRTCLPLSYVKQHYNLGVYAFVSNVVKIDKREDLDHPSLLCVRNRLEKAIQEEHVQLSVLFIKLAERLYDLRHAAGYIHLTEVQCMAQETLTIDVKLAHAYLGPEIGQALETAAKAALEVGNNTSKHTDI